ncbi:ribonuclease HIII [Virgibacillus proomii]|uniref:ribonuclease HIII n=1 Tax=Virgibacillus proomii TaxID=84407 RepID=UPI001C11F63C|nr:ribonuclease HIII [Virgibacillus proomii]MBU5265633.1 ribonuclease HIII [Virgibacillus proomii]
MSQLVYEFSANKIQQMKEYYTSLSLTPPPGAIFRAKTKDAVITAYKSGKVLFQGSSPEKEAANWLDEALAVESKAKTIKQKPNHSYVPSPDLFNKNHIGTDEAGTGDYFGPITVAGVYITETNIVQLKSEGVTDSKALTDKKIRELANTIITRKIPYASAILHNEKYNVLQKQGWSQGKMKAMLHHHVIHQLLNKIGDAPNQGIIIDQFCEPAVYQKYLMSEKQTLAPSTFFLTKAESYSTAVAAASILARASFLNQMDKLSKQLGLELPKGAAPKVDRIIAKIIKAHGADILDSYAKVHFNNTKKAYAYL